MIKEYLPIGSVVILKGAKKRLMITGYCMRDLGSKKQYDYSGCLYPEGILDTKETALFDHEQIEKVFFKGLVDHECEEFMAKLKEIIASKNE